MYLALQNGRDEIEGVLPLVHRTGLMSGSRLNSLPVVRWAGPLAGSPEDEASLLGAACDLVENGTAGRLTMRCPAGGYERFLPRIVATEEDPSWIVPLPESPKSLLERIKGRSKNRVREIRKSEASGLTIREGTSDADLRRFYRLYLRTMRKHGALPRSFRQFAVAKRLLEPPGIFRLIVAEHRGEVVAGGLFHFFGGLVDLLYGASDDAYLDLLPNHAIYWRSMQLGIAGGYRHLDLGAGREGSSLAAFKRRWGADPVPRFAYVYSVDTRSVEAGRRSMRTARRLQRRRVSRLARAWRRAPLPVTRIAGVLAYRYL
jgi:CelD/BcsL family acetyltransferase involved in cellulose biosynthesis